MHQRIIKSTFRFVLVFALTCFTIFGFSKLSLHMASPSTNLSPNSYIEATAPDDAPQTQAVQAVVEKQGIPILPSVAAFLILTAIPVCYVLFVMKKRTKNPHYFAENAQRYSPKKEITFNNNTFNSEYNRSRM